MVTQFAIERFGTFLGEEDARALEPHLPRRARNGVGQPIGPRDREVDVVRAPNDLRRRVKLAQLRFYQIPTNVN